MLNIATINVQNKYKIKKYSGFYKNEDHVKMLLKLIDKYDLNIIGLQEVNQRYFIRLQEEIDDKFTFYGKFRYLYSFFTKKVYPFSVFNESVPIITNKSVSRRKTLVLPWLSSYVPRIVTIMEINLGNLGSVVVLNTHIDYLKNKTKVKQLKKLEKIIERIRKPVILMGDFNMTLKNDDFRNFIKKMKSLNIERVDINESTFKKAKSNYAIDHIFVSSCFRVVDFFIEKDNSYVDFSDHYPIIVKLDFMV